ncbi:MAG: RNA 2',3'-cyclic phosphodiesterase [Bacteroidales bacterium]|nr:RNA 2',3'-cyclic phosphodiesterase [Bacteroidales bacterium]
MKRIFAAIKIHPSNQFLKVYYDLKTAMRNDKIKWVDTQNIHVTMKFFGETEEDRIENIITILSEISLRYKPFTLELKDVGIFGSSYKPRVIWFGIEENKIMQSLAMDTLDEMGKIGFEKDRQNFVPHLTIGRIKFVNDKKRFREIIDRYKSIEIQKENVVEFSLIESILRPQGPEYKIIETFKL